MLLLHVRTVAFLASVSTTIQCFLWIIGFILYALAYDCGYSTYYFQTSGDHELPIDFKSYYVWYLQGYNCTTSLNWIGGVRNFSASLLLALISIGLVWNIILLSSSIYMLVGFYSNSGTLGLRLKMFSYSVLAVSFWDLILVIVVSIDFAPLTDSVHYKSQKAVTSSYSNVFISSNSTNPSILALPYFTEVFTVVIMLLSRLILFWVLNIFFAFYILAKHASENTRSNTSPSFVNGTLKNNVKPNSFRDNDKLRTMSTHEPSLALPTDGKTYFASDRLPRVPTTVVGDMNDEVKRRWNVTTWQPPQNYHNVEEQDEEYEDFESSVSPSNQSNSAICNEDRWFDVDTHNRNCETRRRSSDMTALSSPRHSESLQNKQMTLDRSPPPLQSKPSFSMHVRQSFSRKPLPKTPPLIKEGAPTTNRNGFSYVNNDNPFNVKLRHIRRESIDSERTEEPATENSYSSGGEANPYLVSSLYNLDPNYEPRDLYQNPPPPPISPSSSDKKISKTLLGPPPPPPKTELSVSAHLRHQMSLEEAIKTRKPLKPVSRPPIDTNC